MRICHIVIFTNSNNTTIESSRTAHSKAPKGFVPSFETVARFEYHEEDWNCFERSTASLIGKQGINDHELTGSNLWIQIADLFRWMKSFGKADQALKLSTEVTLEKDREINCVWDR